MTPEPKFTHFDLPLMVIVATVEGKVAKIVVTDREGKQHSITSAK